MFLLNFTELERVWLLIPPELIGKEDTMFISKEFRRQIDRMFVPPTDYDSIQVQTRETPDEPVLIITLYRNKEIVFFQNYELESENLKEVDITF